MTDPALGDRRPRGYRGIGHETVGGALLGVMGAVSAPETTLGPELMGWLKQVEPGSWYPIARMLELTDVLDARLGKNGLKQMGRELFRRSHAEEVRAHVSSARDLLYGLDRLYHLANRGEDLGGWRVTEFRPSFAAMEKNTPHHCVMEEGILAEALITIGIPGMVRQRECFRAGAEACVYELSAPIYDERWTGRST